MSYNIYSIYLRISLCLAVVSSQVPPPRTVEGQWGPWKNITKCRDTEFMYGQVRERECLVEGSVVDRSFCEGMYRLIAQCEHPKMWIVAGAEAEFGSWPWQVFIELDNGRDQCGGSLIEDMWILTAAHCLSGGKNATRILLSSNHKLGESADAINTLPERIICHEEFERETLTNDICLIKIPWLEPKGYAKPVRYNSTQIVPNGFDCIVTGWGYTEDFDLPLYLREAVVKIIDKQQCEDWHRQNVDGEKVPPRTICAGHEEGGADTCGGDSGGPLVCAVGGGPFVLYGITSFGPKQCGTKELPGVYTSVMDFLPWIEKTIKSSMKGYHWGKWNTTCSVSCGKGQQTMVRKCLNREGDVVNLNNCDGNASKVGECNLPRCIDYTWTKWKGECSVTCGHGTVKNTRTCIDEENKTVNAELCGDGKDEEFSICYNTRNCSDAEYKWSSWKLENCTLAWCLPDHVLRTRQCLLGDKVSENILCQGHNYTILPCFGNCEEIFTWGQWQNLSCSVSCGQGVMVRRRFCLTKDERVEGDTCPGESKEEVPCTQPACEGSLFSPMAMAQSSAVAFSWGTWTKRCSVTCGTGIETRTRECLDFNNEVVSKDLCPGRSTRKRRCKLPPCPTIAASQPVSITFHWSTWNTECSVTCGSGLEKRTRNCLDSKYRVVTTSNCVGKSTERAICTRATCINYQWVLIDTSCSVTCGKGQELKVRKCTNGAGEKVDTKLCSGSQYEMGTCSLPPCVVLSPSQPFTLYKWGRWKSWSKCRVGSSGKTFRWSKRYCLMNRRDVPPQLCRNTIGGDDYKEEFC